MSAARLLEERSALAARRYAGWSRDAFVRLADAPVTLLASALARVPDAERVLRVYLELLADAFAHGHLDEDGLLGALLLREIPHRLPELVERATDRDAPLHLLAQLYNLGEGLRRGAPWLDAYVASRLPPDLQLTRVDAVVGELLGAVVGPARPRPLRGSLRGDRVDLRACVDTLLPGTLTLLAPRVVCVADREEPEVQVAVYVGANSEPEVLGRVEAHGLPVESRPLRLEHQMITLDERTRVFVPGLMAPRAWLAAPAGFLVITAEDSQSVWVVRPTEPS